MRREIKISAWILSCVALFFVVLLGAIWGIGNTDLGRGWIENATDRLTGGHVMLSGLNGSFPTQLTLRELQLRDRNGVWLTADDLSVRWSPLELLEKRIEVNDLRLAKLRIERAPQSGSSGGKVTIPHIEVQRFMVDVVELGAPLVGTPARLSLHGTLQLRSLERASGDVAAHRLDGDGDYTLRLRFDPTNVDASLQVHEPASGPLENLLSLPGLGALGAQVTLHGPRDAGQIDLRLTAGELRGAAHGTIDLTHASANLDYSLQSPALAPRPDLAWRKVALEGTWHGSAAAPEAHGSLDIDGLRIAGSTFLPQIRAEFAAGAGTLTGRATVTGLQIPGPQPLLFAHDPWKIEATVQLAHPSRPLDLTAVHPLLSMRARCETLPVNKRQQDVAIEVKIPDIAPFAAFAGQDVRGGASVRSVFKRGSDATAVKLDAEFAVTGGASRWTGILGPRIAVNLSAAMTDASIKVDELRLVANVATLTASGIAMRRGYPANDATSRTAAPGGNFFKELQGRWDLQLANLSALSPEIAGDLKASGRINGPPNSMLADAEVTSNLSVRGSPSGAVSASMRARGLPSAPSGTIEAQGMLDDAPLRLDADVDHRDGAFHVVVRQAQWKSARMGGDVAIGAELAQSHGQLRLAVAQLSDLDRVLGLSIAGSLDAKLDAVPGRGRTEGHLDLDGKDLVIGGVAGDLHLQATGVPAAVALQLTAHIPSFYGTPVSLNSAAVLDADTRALRIASVSAVYRGETFRLMSPAVLSYGKGLSVDEVKVGARQAVFDLQGQLWPMLDLKGSLLHVDHELINSLEPDLLASGTLEVYTRLQGSPMSPVGSVRLEARDVRLADDAATGLPALDLHATAQLANESAAIKGSMTAGSGSQLTVSGSAPLNASGSLDMKIGGKLDAGMANPLLEARGLHATGAFLVNATVTGSSNAPQVGGGITLTAGSLRDYARGISLSDINAEIVGNQGGLQIKSFNAKAATGTVGITGTFGVLQQGMPVDLKIIAKNAQPVASNIVTANLDADLHVTGKVRERIDVAGMVHVNRATIGIPDSLPPEVAVLDVRRRGSTAVAASSKQLIVGVDVVIRAPQEILVQGRGLDAELGGEIQLSGTTAELLASGGFDLRQGSFTLVGNKLSLLTPGRVGFDGAGLRKKIDPTLDFTAQTTVGDTTVTLRITGVADAPRFDFTSSPQLPPDEIMARLLFGENAASLSALQLAQIGAALATLSGVGGSGSNPLVKLQKSLGLDRLTVASNTTTTATGATESSGAAIAAGRYVTRRVYVEGKQTTTGASQVQVDVDLTKHLKLQTRLGTGTVATQQGTTPENDPGSSVGLSYQFEY